MDDLTIPLALFCLAAVAIIFTAVWALIELAAWTRRRRRERIRAEVDAIIADPAALDALILDTSAIDVIELDAIAHDVVQVPSLQRLHEMTQEELIDAYLSQARECVRLSVENRALNNEVNEMCDEADRQERAKRRHWKTILRMRAEHG